MVKLGAKFPTAVFYQPERSGFAIVRTVGIGVLWREPILDRDHRLSGVIGDPLQHRALHVGAAEYPSAAMQVQIDATWAFRPDYSQRDEVTILAIDGDAAGPRRYDRGRKRPFAAPSHHPHCFGAGDPPLRLAFQQLDHLCVLPRRLRIDRRVRKQLWIKRVCVDHSPPALSFVDVIHPGPGTRRAAFCERAQIGLLRG
jgi:hypothetical protein